MTFSSGYQNMWWPHAEQPGGRKFYRFDGAWTETANASKKIGVSGSGTAGGSLGAKSSSIFRVEKSWWITRCSLDEARDTETYKP